MSILDKIRSMKVTQKVTQSAVLAGAIFGGLGSVAQANDIEKDVQSQLDPGSNHSYTLDSDSTNMPNINLDDQGNPILEAISDFDQNLADAQDLEQDKEIFKQFLDEAPQELDHEEGLDQYAAKDDASLDNQENSLTDKLQKFRDARLAEISEKVSPALEKLSATTGMRVDPASYDEDFEEKYFEEHGVEYEYPDKPEAEKGVTMGDRYVENVKNLLAQATDKELKDLGMSPEEITQLLEEEHAYTDLKQEAFGPFANEASDGKGFQNDAFEDAKIKAMKQAKELGHDGVEAKLQQMDHTVDVSLEGLQDSKTSPAEKLEIIQDLYGGDGKTGIMSDAGLLIDAHEKLGHTHDHDGPDIAQDIDMSR